MFVNVCVCVVCVVYACRCQYFKVKLNKASVQQENYVVYFR